MTTGGGAAGSAAARPRRTSAPVGALIVRERTAPTLEKREAQRRKSTP